MRFGLVALCLLSFSCIKQTPPVRLAEPANVAIAFAVDSDSDRAVTDPPEELKAAIEAELQKRNLVTRRIPHAVIASAFAGSRDSGRRYAHAKTLSEGAPLVLLVELKTQFFSQLTGQYRWQVFGKLSAGKTTETIDANTDVFEQPVFLQFDHQRGDDAMRSASGAIAERTGTLFDGFIGGAAQASALPPAKADLGLLYFVMVDRFANGDPRNDGVVDRADENAFHGGDLQGVIDRLDYLKDLGVETVWLSPVFKMRTEKFYGFGAFHGYWTYDLNVVEPRFGDEALLAKLSEELHKRKMKLLLDLVLNHVGPDSPLVAQKPKWFHRKGALEKWDDPNEVVSHDVHGLPDLAQENEEVYQHLLSASLGWIDRVKPDGFRLDAVKHIPTAFWSRFNDDVRRHAGADFVLLGELLDGDARELSRVWREGRFTHMFDFPLHFAMVDTFCKGQPVARLAATLSLDGSYPDPNALVTLVDNHDLARISTACGGDAEKVQRALQFMFTTRGSPSLTWGVEVGHTGEKEPANRADMVFDSKGVHVEDVRSLSRARQSSEALRTGLSVPLALEPSFFSYARVGARDGVLVSVNESGRSRDVAVPGPLAEWVEQAPSTAASSSVSVATLRPREGFGAYFERLKARRLALPAQRAVRIRAEAPTGEGDSMFLVGSGPELGAWNPMNGLGPLSERFEAKLPENVVYEYKLVIRRSNGKTDWEPGTNRALLVNPGSAPLELNLSWGKGNG